MEVDDLTLKELGISDLEQQPLSIVYPNLEVGFKLKFGLMHLLPIFRGLVGDESNKHMKEFHIVCYNMKPFGITEKKIKLKTFPFSLVDSAKEWMYYLTLETITT